MSVCKHVIINIKYMKTIVIIEKNDSDCICSKLNYIQMDHKNILNTGFCVLSKIKDFWNTKR